MTRVGDTEELTASDYCEEVRDQLRDILNSDAEDLFPVVENLREEMRLRALELRADEKVAETQRWEAVDEMVQEGMAEGFAQAREDVGRAFRLFGPEGERMCSWDRTMAEPWASIAAALSVSAGGA